MIDITKFGYNDETAFQMSFRDDIKEFFEILNDEDIYNPYKCFLKPYNGDWERWGSYTTYTLKGTVGAADKLRRYNYTIVPVETFFDQIRQEKYQTDPYIIPIDEIM